MTPRTHPLLGANVAHHTRYLLCGEHKAPDILGNGSAVWPLRRYLGRVRRDDERDGTRYVSKA